MLVLSRKPNQSIIISSDIVITVIEVRGDQVRLGIKAPRSVTVHREEVAAEIRAANREASSMAPSILGDLPPPPVGKGGTKPNRPARPPKLADQQPADQKPADQQAADRRAPKP